MATEILAIGTTGESSGDVTVSPGSTLTVCLKDAAGSVIGSGASVEIQLKDDGGEYFTVATLSATKLALVITGAGVYRFTRRAGTSCGVFSG